MLPKFSFLKPFFAALLVGGLIFYSQAFPLKKLRETFLRVLKPLMITATAGKEFLGNYPVDDFSEASFASLRFEIEKLKEENALFKRALRFKEENALELKGARVLLYLKSFGQESLLIDQGKNSGIRENDWAVDKDGMVLGRILEAGEDFSKINLASNAGEAFEAEIFPQKIKAVAKGLGGRSFALEFVPQDSPVRVGDFVSIVSPGASRLLLAHISEFKKTGAMAFAEVKAALILRPEILREVFIIVK